MLTQTSEYALRAMACMAMRPDENLTAGSLAKATQVPGDYLAKVLQQLSGAGLINGRRGVGGGYSLARQPANIKLLEVIQAVSPMNRIRSCPLGLESHGVNLCPLHRTVDNAIKAAMDVFDDISLADLLNQPGANTPLCEAQNIIRSATVSISAKARV